jgi:hypothetical protein
MALLAGLLGVAGRFAGRLLNSSLGWATLLLFGKVAGTKQTVLNLIALASLAWVVVLVGVVFPSIGTFLLAFAPVPDFVDENLVRLAMLAAALLIPLLVGVAGLYITDAAHRPKGVGVATTVLRGYPFTFVLALTIALLAGVSIVRKVRSLSRRWEDSHVAVIVKPGGYDKVVQQIDDVLSRGGVDVSPAPAPAVLSLPPRILDKVAGSGLGELVPDRLVLLKKEDLEILVYPSDLAVSGKKDTMARARALIAAELTSAPAYMTTSSEAEQLEDEIAAVANQTSDSVGSIAFSRQRIAEIDRRLMELTIPYDEWETLYRQRLQVERDLLARHERVAGNTAVRRAAEDAAGRGGPGELGFALGAIALVALDLLFLAAERVSPPRRR